MRPRRIAIALLLGASLAVTTAVVSVAAADTVVECGQLTAYTAPDPLGPTAGTLGIGSLTPWEIVPTATVSAAADGALPSIVNSSPTCVAIELDTDGKVTSLDFAAEGTITGMVEFDSSSGFYLFADRLLVPDFITDAYPGLAALVATSFAAGTSLSMTFSVDVTNGFFSGFDGNAAFCGTGGVTDGGDGVVGDATIPAAVLDADDLEALADAAGDEVCATVHAVGVIVPDSEGQIDVVTDVEILAQGAGAAPTQPATSITDTPASPRGGDPWLLVVGLVASIGTLVVTGRRSRLTFGMRGEPGRT